MKEDVVMENEENNDGKFDVDNSLSQSHCGFGKSSAGSGRGKHGGPRSGGGRPKINPNCAPRVFPKGASRAEKSWTRSYNWKTRRAQATLQNQADEKDEAALQKQTAYDNHIAKGLQNA